jgi:hypothetical protein
MGLKGLEVFPNAANVKYSTIKGNTPREVYYEVFKRTDFSFPSQ